MKRYWAMKWAKDLEAPRRKQAQGYLKEGNGYCCLGRLCVVAGVRWKDGGFDGEMMTLPQSVMEKTGMRSCQGEFPGAEAALSAIGTPVCAHLAHANDAGMKFKDIAKVIRKHWREL